MTPSPLPSPTRGEGIIISRGEGGVGREEELVARGLDGEFGCKY